MKVYIKGNFKKTIFKSDKGYVIGLFRVKETNSAELEDFENKTITFTGYFHELNEEDMYIFYGKTEWGLLKSLVGGHLFSWELI